MNEEQQRRNYEAEIWNAISHHPTMVASGFLFSTRNEIAYDIIPEIDKWVEELTAMARGRQDRRHYDWYRGEGAENKRSLAELRARNEGGH